MFASKKRVSASQRSFTSESIAKVAIVGCLSLAVFVFKAELWGGIVAMASCGSGNHKSEVKSEQAVTIELHSNLGEVKAYTFPTVSQAIAFLNTAELQHVFITTDSLTLFDPPPMFD